MAQLKTLTIGDVSMDANLIYFGTNPTGGAAGDTKALWISLGTGYAYISGNGNINSQPSPNGILMNYVHGSLVFQTWHGTNNRRYSRYGSSTAVDMGAWTEFGKNYTDGRLPSTLQSVELTGNVANNTYVYKGAITADEPCIAIAALSVEFSSNATGWRNANIMNRKNGADTYTGLGAGMVVGANSSGITRCTTTAVATLAAGDRLYARLMQNSGGTRTLSDSYLRAYFIYKP